jgi:TonB family protein
MKLFAAFRAVGLAGLIVTLSVSRLCAQDVTVSDLSWIEPAKPAADTLPEFKRKPDPDYPQDLKKTQPGYVIVVLSIGDDGKVLIAKKWASHPYFQESTFLRDAKIRPATKDGKPVATLVWYSVVFNPKAASKRGEDAVPRLLAVAPVIVGKELLTKVPGVVDDRLPIWTTVKVAADGSPSVVAFDDAAQEKFRGAIEASLPLWRFAPARHDGQAVDAEVPMLFFVTRAPKAATAPLKPDRMPKVIKQERPNYPLSLRATGQQGEVTMRFTVDENGDVKNARVVRSNHPDFEEPALEAVSKWKFKPAMARGKPVEMSMQIPIVFNLNGANLSSGAMEVGAVSKKQQEKLPEALRYDVGPKPKGVLYPVFPFELLIAKTGGKVEVAFVIGEDGRVSDVKVVKADRPEFGESVAAAVAAFEFLPALKEGKPVPSILRMEHEFDANGWKGRPSSEDLSLAAMVRKHPERIMSGAKLDSPLKPVSQRAPVFPLTAKADIGEAVIEVLIDTDGRVRLPKVVSASEAALGYAAAQAAADWRFESPKIGGKAVVVRARLPFSFARITSSKK